MGEKICKSCFCQHALEHTSTAKPLTNATSKSSENIFYGQKKRYIQVQSYKNISQRQKICKTDSHKCTFKFCCYVNKYIIMNQNHPRIFSFYSKPDIIMYRNPPRIFIFHSKPDPVSPLLSLLATAAFRHK